MTDSNLESKGHMLQAALEIAFTDDLSADDVQANVESLVDRSQESGLDINEQEVWDVIDNRADEGEEPATYSWVYLNKFRTFELHERCFPWTTANELRTMIDELPVPDTTSRVGSRGETCVSFQSSIIHSQPWG